MALVDVHTHFFSRPFYDALVAQAADGDERLEAFVAETGLEVPDGDVAAHRWRWLEAFVTGGVRHAVTFASLPEEADAVAAAIADAPDRLTGFALVDPTRPDAVETTHAHFEQRGFKGLLLFPAMHHFHMGDRNAAPVLEVAAEHGGVVVVHCGILLVKLRDVLGLARPFDLAYANPLGIVPAANAFPGIRFVIPHFGAGFFRECLMAGVQCENVYVDTSSSNSWIATQPAPLTLDDVFRRALTIFGAERILFGTDSSTFPRGWRGDVHAAQRAALERIGTSHQELDLIFGGNAERILGLDLDDA